MSEGILTIERWVRLIAGTLVLASVSLAHLHRRYWRRLGPFVGSNLFQSGLANWCLMMNVVRALSAEDATNPSKTG